MKIKLLFIVMFIIAVISFKVSVVSAATEDVYRLYNLNTGEHFYTTSLAEKNVDVSAGWSYEGIGWVGATTGTPVYRVYNPNAKGGDHYYTMSKYEAQSLVNKGWRWDNGGKPAFYSAGNTNLYVAYNPNAQSGSHNYTTSTTEESSLVSAGWKYAQVAWKVEGVGKTIAPPLSASDDYYKNYSSKLTGTADKTVESAIAHGLSYVGKSPYAWGGGRTTASINAAQFDCSSFVSWMYALAGHPIDNQGNVTTKSLWTKGPSVSWSNLKRGDLIIYNAPATKSAIVQTTGDGKVFYNQPADEDSHVVMYLGDGFFLHDSPASPTGGVGINRMSDIEKDQAYFTGETWQQVMQNSQYTIRRVG